MFSVTMLTPKYLLFALLVAVVYARYELTLNSVYQQTLGPKASSDVVYRNLNGTGLSIKYSLSYPSTVSYLSYSAVYSFHDFKCTVTYASDEYSSTTCEGSHSKASEAGCSTTSDGTTSVRTCSFDVPDCFAGNDIYFSLLLYQNGASVKYETSAITKLAPAFDVKVGTNSYVGGSETLLSWILPLGNLTAGKALKIMPMDSYTFSGMYAATSPIDNPTPGTVCAAVGSSSYRPFYMYEKDHNSIPEFYNFVAPGETTMALLPEFRFYPGSFDFTVAMEPTQCVKQKLSVCSSVDYSYASNYGLDTKVELVAGKFPAQAAMMGFSGTCASLLQRVYCSLNLRKCTDNNFVLHPCPSTCEQSKNMMDLVKLHCNNLPPFDFRDTSDDEMLENPPYLFYRSLVQGLESSVKSCDGCYPLAIQEPEFTDGSASVHVLWALMAVFVMMAMF